MSHQWPENETHQMAAHAAWAMHHLAEDEKGKIIFDLKFKRSVAKKKEFGEPRKFKVT